MVQSAMIGNHGGLTAHSSPPASALPVDKAPNTSLIQQLLVRSAMISNHESLAKQPWALTRERLDGGVHVGVRHDDRVVLGAQIGLQDHR
jgi:hypothetical protein